jgi:hypothetical protein
VRVTLLGPQRNPTLDRVVRSLQLDGPIATITAGWFEREDEDAELDRLLDGHGVNLALYRRWLDVQERDPDFAAAYRRSRAVLDELQELYLLRVDAAVRAIEAVRAWKGDERLRGAELDEAIGALRDMDARHLREIAEISADFFTAWPPHERAVIAEHRAEVAQVLAAAAALVITGGNVAVLVAALHLFNVAAALRSPVIAWSAGAMALSEQVVLFHDRPPQGPGNPEVYGRGLSVVRDMVFLPHARARLLLDDTGRMALFARRFAPARCVVLEAGMRIDLQADGALPPGTRVLGTDGRVSPLEPATP